MPAPSIIDDFLHFSDEGRERWAKAMLKIVESVFLFVEAIVCHKKEYM